MQSLSSLLARAFPAGIHLIISACIALVAAAFIFTIWYPSPYSTIAGGLSLFVLLVSVDVVAGPALTFVAASPAKPRRELRRDLAVIVAIQILAFAYGVYTIFMARPVYIVFEIDRFRVVTAVDIDISQLASAPPSMRSLPWSGPRLIAAVKPTNADEFLRATELGLGGVDLSMIPNSWREYSAQADAAWKSAKPVSSFLAMNPQSSKAFLKLATNAGQLPEALRILPLVSRHAEWVVVLAPPHGRVIGYLPFSASS